MWRVWVGGEFPKPFWWGVLRQRYHLEEQGVEGMIFLKKIFKYCDASIDWIDLVQDWFRWRDVVCGNGRCFL
jgi:hypothetical protein